LGLFHLPAYAGEDHFQPEAICSRAALMMHPGQNPDDNGIGLHDIIRKSAQEEGIKT